MTLDARTTPVTVCMATYNGAEYVVEQVESILAQLGPADEVVIVDDGSTDATPAIIESFTDPRIVFHRSHMNRGYVRAFEESLRRASHDVMLLADQDDVWLPNRVDALVAAAERSSVAASNLISMDSRLPLPSPISGRPWRLKAEDSSHHRRNLLRIIAGDAPYFGCAMALRRDALEIALPFPGFLTESHDLWIAIVGNSYGSIAHLGADTVLRRIHESNASSPRPRGIRQSLQSRWMLIRATRLARRRIAARSTVAQQRSANGR